MRLLKNVDTPQSMRYTPYVKHLLELHIPEGHSAILYLLMKDIVATTLGVYVFNYLRLFLFSFRINHKSSYVFTW